MSPARAWAVLLLLLLERSLPRKTSGIRYCSLTQYGPLNQLPGRYRGQGITQKNGCRYKSEQSVLKCQPYCPSGDIEIHEPGTWDPGWPSGWQWVGRCCSVSSILFCLKTSSITQVFITSPSSLLSVERSRVVTNKEICKMLFALIVQRTIVSFLLRINGRNSSPG